MAENSLKSVRLKPLEDRRVIRGQLWVYWNELEGSPKPQNGEIVDVFSSERRFVGRGFCQYEGGIAVRILARHQASVDAEFLAGRIGAAYRFRERIFPGQTVYRWVFGESDGLPGFVADRYGPVVVAETPCMFYASRVEELAHVFLSYPGVEGVRVNAQGAVHRFGTVAPSVECDLDDLRIQVDLEGGQKTGLFLDQRVNARAMQPYAGGARVLDGHCYLGVWSCHAARAGAQRVLGVDTSAHALELARANVRLNGVESVCAFEEADVTEVLGRGERYDVVLLDPPALAKSRGQEHKALGLYQALNRAAIEAVDPGGVLVTSSCSHFISRGAFLEMLKRAATAARRQAWILDIRGAAPDHPVILAMPETAYLTCVTLRLL